MTTIILPISDSEYKRLCSGEACYILRDEFPNVSAPFKIVLVRKKDSGRSIISRALNAVHAGVVMGKCYCESKEWYSFVSFDDCFADKSATSHEELSQYTDGLKYMFAAYKITGFKRATKHRTVKDYKMPCKKNKTTPDKDCHSCPYAFVGITSTRIICDRTLKYVPKSYKIVEDDEE